MVGGIFTLLARRILSGEAAELEHFTPPSPSFALTPFLGAQRARQVTARHG